MLKQYIIRISGLIAVLILIGFCGFHFINSRFTYNDENSDGNTAANLLNNGLFREQEGKIYFSNLKDDGKLYVMNSDFSNFKCLSNDKISNINVSDQYIIYSKINNKKQNKAKHPLEISSVGIYRMDLKGNNLAELDTNVNGMVHQYGNSIYYQTLEKNSSYAFHSMDIKGESKGQILKDPIYPASIKDQTLTYAGFGTDHNIHSMDLKTKESSVLLNGHYFHVAENNGFLYMINMKDNYSISRMNLSTKKVEKLVSDRTCTYNVTSDNRYLYYQVDNGTDNGLYRLNLETKETVLLVSGNYSNINLTNQYAFFTDMKEQEMYAVKIGDNASVQAFNPMVVKK